MDGWNTTFLLGRPIFRGYVSFREGIGCITKIRKPPQYPHRHDGSLSDLECISEYFFGGFDNFEANIHCHTVFVEAYEIPSKIDKKGSVVSVLRVILNHGNLRYPPKATTPPINKALFRDY